jgi:bifunctional non-homologous end joining protein LigD
MVPHLKGRPIVMHRFQDNILGEGFFQQQIPVSAPEWIKRATVKKVGGTTTHLVCNEAGSLIYLANLGCITPHIWLSREDRPEIPDQIIFDLDPASEDFNLVRQGARDLKQVLDEIGLISFLKTTGSHGLHVVIPIRRSGDYARTRTLAQEIAEIITRQEPRKFTTEQRKDKRQDRLFIDTLRNAYAHTAVAPYAVRARKSAPVAAPLFWEELNDPDLTSARYNIRNIFQRIEKSGDPWKDLERHPQSLDQPARELQKMRQKLGL